MSMRYQTYRDRMRRMIAGLRLLRGACPYCGATDTVTDHASECASRQSDVAYQAAVRAQRDAEADLARRVGDCNR